MARKLAHQAQASIGVTPSVSEKRKADGANAGNWFGESIKGNNAADGGSSTSAGVGKYLKRTRDAATIGTTAPEEPSKKRKIGWGDFTGW